MARGNSDEITREYFDRILIMPRLIDSCLPDTGMELFGRHFDTPICTAALSHMNDTREKGMAVLARGAKLAGAVNFCGMESYEGEIEDICNEGAATVRIIKPHANNRDVIDRIELAKSLGVFGIGMDIDHAFTANGEYDNVFGLKMRSKTQDELRMYVEACGDTPFIVKGVLSVEDAVKCADIGAAGIVISHHHGIMPYSVPPLMMLPQIKEAVGDKLKIFVDCMIESGADAYKALALGADAVCVGRNLIGYLKESGAEGVASRIKQINGELKGIMARTGYTCLKDMDDSCLVRNF